MRNNIVVIDETLHMRGPLLPDVCVQREHPNKILLDGRGYESPMREIRSHLPGETRVESTTIKNYHLKIKPPGSTVEINDRQPSAKKRKKLTYEIGSSKKRLREILLDYTKYGIW